MIFPIIATLYTRTIISIMTSMARDEIFTRNSSNIDQLKNLLPVKHGRCHLCVSQARVTLRAYFPAAPSIPQTSLSRRDSHTMTEDWFHVAAPCPSGDVHSRSRPDRGRHAQSAYGIRLSIHAQQMNIGVEALAS